MRITNSMLNATSTQSGMPLNQSSLLNYIDNESTDDELLALLQKNKAGKNKEKSGYEKLEEISEKLAEKALQFTAKGKDSLFEKARESGDREEIWERAEELVKSYNNLLKELGTTSTGLEDYYKKMLLESVKENGEGLGQIGITQQKDGTLKLDREKLKAADLDTLEKVLGREGGFSVKTALISGRITENARANAESLSGRYDASGKYRSAAASQYDFWG